MLMETSSEKPDNSLELRVASLEERIKMFSLRLDSEQYKRYKLKKKVGKLSSKLESLGEKVSEVEGYLYEDDDDHEEESDEE